MLGNRHWGELPSLSGETVVIAPFSSRDVPAMITWNQDVAAQRWFDWPTEMPPLSRHESYCLAVIDGWRADWASGRRAPFAVRHIATGETVGSVELQRNDAGQWSVSYLTHPDWRGRGIATEAVRLACDWAFDALDVDEIVLVAAESNLASCVVASKAGFADTGRRTASLPLANFAPDIGTTDTMVHYALARVRSSDAAE